MKSYYLYKEGRRVYDKEDADAVAVIAELVEMLESIVKPGAYKDLDEIQALINKHKGGD